MCLKYAIICLQFVLHSKTQAQWASEQDSSSEILASILQLIGSSQAVVNQQAVKSIYVLLQNHSIGKLGKISVIIRQFIESR